MAFVVVIIGWFIIYVISKAFGDKRTSNYAENWLTGGFGFKGCGVALLIVIIILAIAFYIIFHDLNFNN